MPKERTSEYLAMFNSFQQPDAHSYGVYKLLADFYPAFGKKIFEGNPFMMKLIMSGYNPMDILEYPVCGRCETLAAWNGYARRGKQHIPQCTCMAEKCGHTTVNPVTLRQWMADELKKKAPPDIAEIADFAVDSVAEAMTRMATNELMVAMGKVSEQKNEQMGIMGRFGKDIVSENKIEVHAADFNTLRVDDEIKKIEEELANA
jgi:hypothetical protein